MVEICEAEQRSKLLLTLMRLGICTIEVEMFLSNQRSLKRSQKPKNGKKSEISIMKDKLNDSKRDEDLLRKERNALRKELEEGLDKNKYSRVMKKLKAKVMRIKTIIKKKNRKKISKYKKEKEEKEISELSNLQETMGEYGALKVFQGISIQQEEKKPPVIGSEDVILSNDELAILSKSPKFALRSMMNKEKKVYGRV
jgi:hypothetical protein